MTYVEVDRNLQIPTNDANIKNSSMGSSKIYCVNVNVPTSIKQMYTITSLIHLIKVIKL